MAETAIVLRSTSSFAAAAAAAAAAGGGGRGGAAGGGLRRAVFSRGTRPSEKNEYQQWDCCRATVLFFPCYFITRVHSIDDNQGCCLESIS